MRRNFRTAGLWIVGALSLTTPGRKVVDKIFWDQVLHVAEPLANPMLEFAKDYGIALVMALLGMALITTSAGWSAFYRRVKITVNQWLLVAAAGGLVLIIGVGGYYWDKSRGPIVWNFNIGSPVTWQKAEGHPLWIGGFQVMGTNRWDASVLPIEAYIKSDINGRVVPLLLDGGAGYGPVKAVAIPGHVDFTLRAQLNPPPPQAEGQLLATDFLATFGRFTLVFEYEGGKSVRSFSADDVTKIIAEANAASGPKPSLPKGVVLRDR